MDQTHPGVIGTEELRLGAIRSAVEYLAATAITAPKSGGQLFLRGGKPFIETVAVIDKAVQHDIAEWMLRNGAKPDLDNTPLIHAAAENDVKMAKLLLDYGADIEKANGRFETPLGFACSYDAVDTVRLLCERGAFVNGTEGWGNSYLYWVRCKTQSPTPSPQQVEIEQILLSFGAEVIEEEAKLKHDD